MTTITVPNEYGYVLLTAVSTFFVSQWLGTRVVGFRRRAKIDYPYEYASYEQVTSASPGTQSALYAFNCAQRAHQNFNENHTSAVGSMLIAGLVYPRAAAVTGLAWTVNRIVYAVGYTASTKPGGRGRYYGIAWMFAHLGLLGMAGVASWKLLGA